MSALDDLQSAIAAVAGRVGSSVVGIGRHQRGSGFVVADGRVLTNAHNLRGDEVTIGFPDGRSTRATVAGVDVDRDLAVIDVDTAGAPALAWAAQSGLAVGSVVFAAAATPTGGTRVTVGTVSALARAFRGPRGRRIAGSVEHTAPLAPGSSGGPILNAAGELLGLNTSRLGEGFYLAQPADASLRERVEALGRGESTERPRLGVAIAPAYVARRLRRSVGLPDRDGLLVRGVEDGSPAALAGIAAGDLIVGVSGRAVTEADELADAITAAATPYEIAIVRGAEERTVTIGAAASAADA